MSVKPDIDGAAAILGEHFPTPPVAVLVLGSGLSQLADAVEDPVQTPFADLPGFPASGVVGHAGRYVAGRLGGRPVLIQAGRYHVYEGHPDSVVVAPVRVAAALGAQTLMLTNAAGGTDPTLGPGDLILVDDHINFMFRSPLAGPTVAQEERFPDMSAPYDEGLQDMAMSVALGLGIRLRRGTYAAVTGPSYETAAEVRMLGRLGADVVGMSTVPEAIAARALGLRCLAISMVTNKGTGLSHEPLGHDEVVAVGQQAGQAVGRILEEVVRRLPDPDRPGGRPLDERRWGHEHPEEAQSRQRHPDQPQSGDAK